MVGFAAAMLGWPLVWSGTAVPGRAVHGLAGAWHGFLLRVVNIMIYRDITTENHNQDYSKPGFQAKLAVAWSKGTRLYFSTTDTTVVDQESSIRAVGELNEITEPVFKVYVIYWTGAYDDEFEWNNIWGPCLAEFSGVSPGDTVFQDMLNDPAYRRTHRLSEIDEELN